MGTFGLGIIVIHLHIWNLLDLWCNFLIAAFFTVCFHLSASDAARWMCPPTSGKPPCPRQGHACAVVGNRLFVHGGMAGAEIFGDLHVLDLGNASGLFAQRVCVNVGLWVCVNMSRVNMYVHLYICSQIYSVVYMCVQ